MSPTPALELPPTTAAFDAALGPELLALLDAHDAVCTGLAQLMDDAGQENEDAETPAEDLQLVLAQSEYLDELREALAQALRQRRDAAVRADLDRPESAGACAPS